MLCLTPFLSHQFLPLGLLDYPDGNRKTHSLPVPRIGGILIMLAVLLSLSAGRMFAEPGTLAASALARIPWLLPGVAAVFLGGLLDDLYDLRPLHKLGFQVLGACLLYAADVRIHSLAGVVLPEWVSFAATMVWQLGMINALNVVDGLDGLAGGLTLIAIATICVAAWSSGRYELAALSFPIAGALIGFLIFNSHPATIFLGDCGSQLLGLILGCLGILWVDRAPTLLAASIPLLAFYLPLFDLAIATSRRFIRGKSIFSGDRRHIHHRIRDLGFSPRRTVYAMYLLSAAGSVAALVELLTPARGLAIVVFLLGLSLLVHLLGYAEFGLAARVWFGAVGRRVVDWGTHFSMLDQALDKTRNTDEIWEVLQRDAPALGLTPTRMCLDGKSYERPASAPSHSFEMHVHLCADQYVTFAQRSSDPFAPVCVSSFVYSLRRQVVRLNPLSPVASAIINDQSAVAPRTLKKTRPSEALDVPSAASRT
ncbi:hypothetical protein F183_A28800 [Bryobacterales bacterium F-183]|nr:hypothetical protein F183_A28800 [Bryobacterales bacterium F-183]